MGTFYNPSLRPPVTRSQSDLSQETSSHLKDLRVVGCTEYRAVCRSCIIYDTYFVHKRDNKNSGILAEVRVSGKGVILDLICFR